MLERAVGAALRGPTWRHGKITSKWLEKASAGWARNKGLMNFLPTTEDQSPSRDVGRPTKVWSF